MHEESMLVERCGLSETGTSKSLALGLSWAAKSSHPACPGATSAAKIDPKSNQNRSQMIVINKSVQNRSWGIRASPDRFRSASKSSQDAPRAAKDAFGTPQRRSRGDPGCSKTAQEHPRRLQERSWDAPEVPLERPKTLVKCARVAECFSGPTQSNF